MGFEARTCSHTSAMKPLAVLLRYCLFDTWGNDSLAVKHLLGWALLEWMNEVQPPWVGYPLSSAQDVLGISATSFRW